MNAVLLRSVCRWATATGILLPPLIVPPAALAQINWGERHSTPSPPPRDAHAMAYDSARGRTVLFGGYDGSTTRGDTWEWDGALWHSTDPAVRPPARAQHSLAYDSARGRTVLFGGSSPGSGALTDTWEWDGTTWIEQFPATSPPPRIGAAMTFDSVRGRTLLFGGDDPGLTASFADTWEWDGVNWTLLQPATSPTARGGAAMAFDTFRGRALLFGGADATFGLRIDTWEWDGTTWTLLFPATSPPPRSDHVLSYDSARARTVLFGGNGGCSSVSCYSLRDTWEWNGTTWTQLVLAARPPARSGAAFVFDAGNGLGFLFGGTDLNSARIFGDTWSLGPLPTAQTIAPASGSESGNDVVHLYGIGFTGASDTVVTFGGTAAALVGGTSSHLTVRTPPGTGGVDVAVTTALGTSTLASAFGYAPPAIAARFGNVNEGAGDREAVLQVDGNTGDLNRELSVRVSQRIDVYMQAPSSRSIAGFVLYVWLGSPTATTLVTLPRGLGAMVCPPTFTGGSPQPRVIFNNLGYRRTLGSPNFPSTPAPSLVFARNSGSRSPVDLTFQGLIQDDGATTPAGVSVTNAVVLHVTP